MRIDCVFAGAPLLHERMLRRRIALEAAVVTVSRLIVFTFDALGAAKCARIARLHAGPIRLSARIDAQVCAHGHVR